VGVSSPPAIAPAIAGQAGVAAAVAAGRLWTLEQIEAEPVFTPVDRQPRLLNEWAIRRLLEKSTGRLMNQGLEGRVGLWILIDERGRGRKAQLLTTSGRREFDEAALAVVSEMRFRPAQHHGRTVPVWVQLPIRFDAL
jgi:TonB family protein